MTKGCEDFIMLESAGEVIFASLKYEQLPLFCSHCGIVGYSLDVCQAVKGWKREGEQPARASAKIPKQKPTEGE